ncbi:hypothetical protein [Caldivirga sp. UBA161]|uniref:hypothetical protein n=1 Tax=Caldivirga sp. UBA161 TaxID=1915569 RepID=UPI0025C59582|nr:hypothetical protein [Caldivirga sp. UBA161]
MLLELNEDGSFMLKIEGSELRGHIKAVATGEDVVKASYSNQSFVAAKVFLPEAVEEAKKRNVKLINIEDVAEPLAALMISLLSYRRADLLIRVFNAILPPQVARHYSYNEYKDLLTSKVNEASFTTSIEMPSKVASLLFEDLNELLAELSAKMSRLKGVDVEFTVKKSGGSYNLSFSFSTELRVLT